MQYWLCSGRGRNKVSFVTHRAQRCHIALLAAVPELAQAQPGFVGAAGCAVAIFIFADRVVALPRIAGRFGGGDIAQARACAAWLQVDAPELSSGPIDEVQEVSRVGAQGVTSKSKLLAREMPRLCSRGLRVNSEAAKSLKVAPAQSGPKSMRRSSPRDLHERYRR